MEWRCVRRSRIWPVRRAAAGALAVLALAAACTGRDYGDDALTDIGTDIEISPVGPDTKERRGAKRDAAPVESATPSTRGTIAIRVRDDRDRPRPGVTVRFISPAGTRTALVESDGKGVARVAATPGIWRAEIPTGCSGQMIVSSGGSARIGVTERATVRGVLQVDATRRFMPGPPVKWPTEPPWAPRQDVPLRFRIIDRCDDVPVPDLEFEDALLVRAKGAIRVLEYAPSSDDDGWTSARIQCLEAGDAKLLYYDRFNPSDRVDVLTITAPLDPSAPWCGG